MKTKKSTWLPLLLLVYLMVMAYVGRGQVAAGKYLQYFGVMGVSLLVIVLLHFTLKHKERLKKLRENDEELPQRSRKEGNEEKMTRLFLVITFYIIKFVHFRKIL